MSIEATHEEQTLMLNALIFLAGDGDTVKVAQKALAQALDWPGSGYVSKALKALEHDGLIRVNRTPARSQEPNSYVVLPMGHDVAQAHNAGEAA